MKKVHFCNILLLFFLIFCSFPCISYSKKIFNNNLNLTNAKNIEENRRYNVVFNNKNYTFYSDEILANENISKVQLNFVNDFENVTENIKKLSKMGLKMEEICKYLRPETNYILSKLENLINIQPKDDYVKVIKNTCKINYYVGDEGRFINKDKFFNDIFSSITKKEKNINIKIETQSYKDNSDIHEEFMEKSCFSTKFNTSSFERKNNIKLALGKFDGLVLEEGEILSFNKVTGIRNEEAGYMSAKIISNGTFIQGFGGGVCQVSTTLYNACLLAGLEVLEVHGHSLPVSYVEPSFDAMVNSGSSDLIVRNNTNGKILITTSNLGDECKVKIYGKKNKYKITRISEKIKMIPATSETIDYDYQKYKDFMLEAGEEKRISYAKEGFYSNGYLNFYDEKGNLIKTQKIRENRYNPTKGIVVKRIS